VEKIAFSGVKRFDAPATGEPQDGPKPEARTVREEPFSFEWELGAGVYVVASYENLRGKSSVLEVMRWALRGRSQMREVVQSWVRRVAVVFRVGAEQLAVEFDVLEGCPVGGVRTDGQRRVRLAGFDGGDSFEQVMQTVMMPRLHLVPVVTMQEDRVVEHTWPAYASALSVSSNAAFLKASR